jgi:hypothetical protein
MYIKTTKNVAGPGPVQWLEMQWYEVKWALLKRAFGYVNVLPYF